MPPREKTKEERVVEITADLETKVQSRRVEIVEKRMNRPLQPHEEANIAGDPNLTIEALFQEVAELTERVENLEKKR